MSRPAGGAEGGGWLLGPDEAGRWLRVLGDRIAEVGSGPPPALAAPPGGPLSCEGARLEPGRVNAHTHLYSGLAPLGMPAPDPAPRSFLEILERVWWRLDRALDAQSLRASARLYIARALLSGTTGLVDHHESPAFIEGSLAVLAEACAELGARALLCYGITERNGGPDEVRRGLAECRRQHETEAGSIRLRVLVGLHASFTLSDAAILQAADLCRELDTPLHVHVAEADSDVADARARGYADPLDRFMRLDALPPGSILAHGVHLGSEAVRRAAEAGCSFVHNPRSNAGNGVGWAATLASTDRVALGTDGYPAEMGEEVAAAEAGLARHGQDPALALRRLHAGRRLLAERFGAPLQLLPGALADLVVRDAAGARHVLVGGRPVVRDRVLATADTGAIEEEARRQAARLWRAMAEID